MDNNDTLAAALAAFSFSKPKEIEYRVYYDPETGSILNYTNEELPGDYILVDKDVFARHRFDCSIKDGKMIPYRLPMAKLVPGDQGTACDPNDITLLVSIDAPHQFWRIKTYEPD